MGLRVRGVRGLVGFSRLLHKLQVFERRQLFRNAGELVTIQIPERTRERETFVVHLCINNSPPPFRRFFEIISHTIMSAQSQEVPDVRSAE